MEEKTLGGRIPPPPPGPDRVNPIAYSILRLSQLRGWDFYPTPQRTMLKLLD